jgi:pyruvate/2-oxoglutarate/acetoin dehydrogenase E1 component
MRTGREQLVAALAAFASSATGVLVGEGVGVAGLAAGLTGNLLRTPLSEAGSVGVAVGLALAGKRPVVELIDLVGLSRAFEALAEAVALGTRSNGAFTAPIVVLAPLADGASIPALPEGVALAVAGVPEDAAGLFAAALASRGPVVVLFTDAALDGRGEGAVPGIGVPVVRRAGVGVTVLAEGAGVALALESAGGAEVVDLRGCRDPTVIGGFVAKTGRAVVLGHADPRVLAAVNAAAFWRLEARPLSLPANAGPEALAAALSDSFTP